MNFIGKRIKFHFVFFKSIVVTSAAIGMLFGWFVRMIPGTPPPAAWEQETARLLLFVPLGVLLTLAMKETGRKETYYFYYNQGITKPELWSVSVLFSFSFYFIFNLGAIVCRHVWKWIA